VIFSVKTIIPRQCNEYDPFPTFVENNGTFSFYYRAANANVDSCHEIDAIVNRFEIKTRMLMDYDSAMDRGDLYT
jgi:hypothetical protein